MICFILGGGAGSRLYPLTEQRCKPAVPIGGKYRLIDIPISNCLNSGLRRIYVLTQFNSASLNKHIKNTYHFGAFGAGYVDILAAEQRRDSMKWFQGTADAVRQSMHHLVGQDFEHILILSGDQLYQMDFSRMAQCHAAAHADVTIATIPVAAHEAPDFGIMKVDGEGLVRAFVEKPPAAQLPEWRSPVPEHCARAGRHHLASMGIYLFSKKALERVFAEHPEATDFGRDIFPACLADGYRIASLAHDGYWTDIGSIGSFFEANLGLTDPIPQFNLFDNANPIYSRPLMLPPSKVFGTSFDRAVVSEGSIIHAEHIERSLVGIRARIGTQTRIVNSVVMGSDYFESLEEVVQPDRIPVGIGDRCTIERAIIDKNCRIGHDVVIRGDHSLRGVETATYCIVNGIVVVKKGAVIPHGTRIGMDWENPVHPVASPVW